MNSVKHSKQMPIHPSTVDYVNDTAASCNIDPAFVIPKEHRPKVIFNEYEVQEQIPVIDLKRLQVEGSSDFRETITAIGKACEDWGFFQVIGHGIPPELLNNIEEKAREFFEYPLEEKLKVRRNFRNGYGYYESELTKNVRDWKEVFDTTRKRNPSLPDNHPANQVVDGWVQYPDKPDHFREAVEAWYQATEKLSFELLKAISLSLGLPPDHFNNYFANHSSLLRLNYYPTCPDPSIALGISRHKDAGALTVLVQDEVGGLQVRKKDGSWTGVKPMRDAYVINIGDIFQVWSNDKYKSVEHRVVVNEFKSRMSFPFFFSPSYDTDYAPVSELITADNPPRYKAINWGEFSRKRNDGNFADFGEEIQISHFAQIT